MRTDLCRTLGIDLPIFAFTHCRDVVAAVSRAGGLGVLGVVGFDADQLETELRWLDEHVGDRPYGIDTIIPRSYEGIGELDPERLEAMLEGQIPDGHRAYVRRFLSHHGVPELPAGEEAPSLIGWTQPTALPQIETARRHERVRLVANALGTPPPEIVDRLHAEGRLVAALAGRVEHARRHVEDGVDVVIARGTEGGGHTGTIASVVLWPQVIEAVHPTPVLAAGGIGSGRQMAAALAMGAQGVWTGSIWLTTRESDCPPAQVEAYLEAGSADTVRSRSFSGKPARMLRTAWTEAWEAEGAPEMLPLPLQGMVTMEAMARFHRNADRAKELGIHPVGQVVGQLRTIRSCRDVIRDLVDGALDSIDRLNALVEDR